MTPVPYDAATLSRLRADAEQIIARYPVARSALLPMLHLVQSEDGYVSPRGIELCADLLGLTTAEVSAVATFYSQYKRRPNGTYTVGVCTNTLCAVLGGDEIFERLSEHLGVGHDETTKDGAITLERVECNAACDNAPVVMVNWEFFDNVTPGGAVETVDRLRAGEDVAPTRGAAKVCTFKEVSRVLAGFPDGRSDEGPGAGPASLAGLRLARERGWSAPAFPEKEPHRPLEAPEPAGKTPPAGRRPAGKTQPSAQPGKASAPGKAKAPAKRPAPESPAPRKPAPESPAPRRRRRPREEGSS